METSKKQSSKPAETYDELLTKFNALKITLIATTAKVSVYEKRFKELDAKKVIQLEAQLASEREMNLILTKKLETFVNFESQIKNAYNQGYSQCELRDLEPRSRKRFADADDYFVKTYRKDDN